MSTATVSREIPVGLMFALLVLGFLQFGKNISVVEGKRLANLDKKYAGLHRLRMAFPVGHSEPAKSEASGWFFFGAGRASYKSVGANTEPYVRLYWEDGYGNYELLETALGNIRFSLWDKETPAISFVEGSTTSIILYCRQDQWSPDVSGVNDIGRNVR
jgi:hypothetical protein